MAIAEKQAAASSRFETDDLGVTRLVGGYSPSSGHHHFPLADCCPYSGAEDIVRILLPTSGDLLYWSVVANAPPGYFGPVPYGLGVVRMTGMALQLVTRLDIRAADEVEEGQTLFLDIETLPGAPGEAETGMWRFVSAEAKA